jgi:glycosyltransferase involved in cell wall biosynthesis
MTKLCVITTHPIQYMAPWFRQLNTLDSIDLHVIFLRQPTALQQGVGFGKAFTWDVPLRDGYSSSVLNIGESYRFLSSSLRKIRSMLLLLKPDVVLVTGWNEPILTLCYPLLRLLGVPVLVRGESNDLRSRGLKAKILHRFILKFVDAVVQIGSANKRFYISNKFSSEKIFPGAYFVDSERMLKMVDENANLRDSVRAQFNFGCDDFVFCFVGKHVAFKQPMLLVEAAAVCNAKNVPVKLLFAGSGELTPVLKDKALALGVDAQFTGFLNQSEMWKAYVPADAFVLPSDYGETWGLVTNEAMLFGLPVIVSAAVGCAEDLVIDGETGYAFSGGAAALAQTMMRLSADRAYAAAMGRNGRERVRSLYSMPVATDGLLQAISSVVPGRARTLHD